MERKEIKEIVEEKIESIFEGLCSKYNLKTGDISPLESVYLDEVAEKITDIGLGFVENNG